MSQGQVWISIAALALVPALIAATFVWERRLNQARDRAERRVEDYQPHTPHARSPRHYGFRG